jgi:hypothetical protein
MRTRALCDAGCSIDALTQRLVLEPVQVPSFVVDGVDLHEAVASEALRAQRHVLLEKPVTTHPEAALRLDKIHREVC